MKVALIVSCCVVLSLACDTSEDCKGNCPYSNEVASCEVHYCVCIEVNKPWSHPTRKPYMKCKKDSDCEKWDCSKFKIHAAVCVTLAIGKDAESRCACVS